MGEIYLYPKRIKQNIKKCMWFFNPLDETFAMSSLGYLWLYSLIDNLDYIDIERVYSDTKTTRIFRHDIDIIAVSMSFDFDILNVLDFLKKNNFNYKASERVETDPLIFAGGPVVTANPEPYKNFFDFIIIGDGETTNLEVIKTICDNPDLNKKQILEKLSMIEGVYVPSIKQAKIVKSTQKLSNCVYTPIISDVSFFKNTFILELERGCANRCAFCLASYINLPIRFPDYETIIKTIDLGLKYTNKIALLGAQVTAHPKFSKICSYLEEQIDNGRNLEVSVSSLRVDSFNYNTVNFLVKAGQRNLTLAIEAGSERLRKVINKNLTDEQIYNAIRVAQQAGLKGIKFYAMIGLPTETIEDIHAFINLAENIKKLFKNFNLSFGFSSFVPKANTPFQWFGRETSKSLEEKIKYLKKELHKIGISASFPSLKWDYYQAVLSRGDETLSDYLVKVYELGGKLGNFKQVAKWLNIDTDYYALQNYDYDKILPWSFIDNKPGINFLKEESIRLFSL